MYTKYTLHCIKLQLYLVNLFHNLYMWYTNVYHYTLYSIALHSCNHTSCRGVRGQTHHLQPLHSGSSVLALIQLHNLSMLCLHIIRTHKKNLLDPFGPASGFPEKPIPRKPTDKKKVRLSPFLPHNQYSEAN